MQYGSTSLGNILQCVKALIDDEGIDALADFRYTQYMAPSRRVTKIDTRILAAVHDSMLGVADWAPDDECEIYDTYRRTLNL